MDYLFVVCLTLLSFFLLTIFQKKRKTISDKILIVWLILLLLTELTFLLQQNGYFKQFYILFEIICTSHILHGTFLFFYYRSFTNPQFSFRSTHLVHLVPFFSLLCVKYILNEVFIGFSCREEGGCACSDNPVTLWISLIKVAVVGIYVIGTFILHSRQKRKAQFLLHNGPEYQAWINIVVYGTFALFSLITIIQLLPVVSAIGFSDDSSITNIGVSVFVLLFLYAGNKFAFIDANPFKPSVAEADTLTNIKPLDEKLHDQFLIITQLAAEKKPYLDPELSLHSFAEQTGLSPAAVSQAIKASTGQSFPYFINSYRIESLLQKLSDPKFRHYTILAIAFECGFNSKASFNRIFKLHIGKTPSEYISELPKNDN